MRNLFFSKDKLLKISPLRGLYIIFGVAFFMITELGRNVYRPYIYMNQINDFGFADVIGNLFGTITIIFFQLGIANATKKQAIYITGFVTLGIAIYELLQLILPKGTMDWKDVTATLIAGVLSLVLLALIRMLLKDPTTN